MILNFLQFVKELILNPASVFKNYLKELKTKPPYFSTLVALYGIGSMVHQLQQQFAQYDIVGNLNMLQPINNWEGFWAVSILFGFLSGLISYYIGGWFFNIRVRLSGGTSDIKTSRNIYLYSNFVFSIPLVITAIIKTFTTPLPYNGLGSFSNWDFAFLVILISFMYHSSYIGYVGVRTLTNADKTRSFMWFVILPMTLFAFALISLYRLNFDLVF